MNDILMERMAVIERYIRQLFSELYTLRGEVQGLRNEIENLKKGNESGHS